MLDRDARRARRNDVTVVLGGFAALLIALDALSSAVVTRMSDVPSAAYWFVFEPAPPLRSAYTPLMAVLAVVAATAGAAAFARARPARFLLGVTGLLALGTQLGALFLAPAYRAAGLSTLAARFSAPASTVAWVLAALAVVLVAVAFLGRVPGAVPAIGTLAGWVVLGVLAGVALSNSPVAFTADRVVGGRHPTAASTDVPEACRGLSGLARRNCVTHVQQGRADESYWASRSGESESGTSKNTMKSGAPENSSRYPSHVIVATDGPVSVQDGPGNEWYDATGFTVSEGEHVEIVCQTYGEKAPDTKLWDYIGSGWVSDRHLETGTSDPVAPGCTGSLRDVRPGESPPTRKGGPYPIFAGPHGQAPLYSTPSASGNVVGHLPDGRFVPVYCYLPGEYVKGAVPGPGGTSEWDKIGIEAGRSSSGGYVSGRWIPDAYVNSSTVGSAAGRCE
jgi:hypothetical protein